MLTAVFIPATANLHAALHTPVAQRAIESGFGLFTNGQHTDLLPKARPGWMRMAVSVRALGGAA